MSDKKKLIYQPPSLNVIGPRDMPNAGCGDGSDARGTGSGEGTDYCMIGESETANCGDGTIAGTKSYWCYSGTSPTSEGCAYGHGNFMGWPVNATDCTTGPMANTSSSCFEGFWPWT
ncbi:MAG TPA: hypothetical protein QF753_05005 [Victivallales bacterium]|nr:hypothetical protein [Victivallales bacterium]